MSRRAAVPLALLLSQCTKASSAGLPATDLGRFASEWLAMSNQNDSAAIARFTREHHGSLAFTPAQVDSVVNDQRQFAGDLGPFTVLKTLASSDTALVLLLRSAKAGSWRGLFYPAHQPSPERVTVEVGPAQPLGELGAAVVKLPLVRTPSGRPILMVSLNGSAPLRFVIDIGTNVSIVTPGALRSILSANAATNAMDTGRFLYDSLNVGGAIYRSGRLLIDDLSTELDGLLGLDMFADLLLTLDYPGSQVLLSRDSLPGADGREILDYTLPRPGSPTIPFTLDGKTYEGVLDVGSVVAMEFPPSLAAQLRWQKPPVQGLRHSGPQLADARSTVGRVTGDAKVAGLTIHQPIVEGMPGDEEILIGQPLLAAFRLTLDQAHRRVRLTLPGPSETHPGPLELAGFRLETASGAHLVDDVIPGTGAAKAGVAIGDTVRTLNGQPVSALTETQIHGLLDTAKTFTLELAHGTARHRVTFARTRLVE